MAQYEGYKGQIDVDDEAITISREGFKARAAFGKVTPRRIPLAALGGIRVQQPTRMVNGWVQLFLGTANKAEPGKNAPTDPDTVLFTHAKRQVLTDLAEALSAIVSANQREGVDPSSAEFEEGSSRASRLEEAGPPAKGPVPPGVRVVSVPHRQRYSHRVVLEALMAATLFGSAVWILDLAFRHRC